VVDAIPHRGRQAAKRSMTQVKKSDKMNAPPAPLDLLKDALLELLEIDALHIELDELDHDILCAMLVLFFQGKLYLSYDPTTGRLVWSPTSEATAEMRDT